MWKPFASTIEGQTLLREVEQWGFPGVDSAGDMTFVQRVFWNNAVRVRAEQERQQQQRTQNQQKASVGR